VNRRFKIGVFLCALAVCAVLIIWVSRNRLNATGIPPIPAPSSTISFGGKSSPIAKPPASAPQRQAEEAKSSRLPDVSSAPIEFYGRVIDQDGKPLPGVDVMAGTGSTTGFMQQETRNYTAVTDANGAFSFKGFRGDALIIELKKTGYNFASDRNRFHYSPIDPDKKRFTPNSNNPVVFQMWKSVGPEPLISYYGRSVHLPADGTPVLIDLRKGTKADTVGDLLISVTWEARGNPGSYAFAWSAKLEVPVGGIMESAGDVIFLAPVEGYRESLQYRFDAQEKQGNLERIFYIRSRNENLFSRVKISLQNNPLDGDVRATFRVDLNPKPGSRILEPPAR
jgi:hypothetical protein